MKKLCVVLIVLILALVISTADSTISVKEYKEKVATPSDAIASQQLNIYIGGITTGFLQANLELQRMKSPMLYCQPDNFTINMKNAVEILHQEISLWEEVVPKAFSEMSISWVLLKGLIKTFPCK